MHGNWKKFTEERYEFCENFMNFLGKEEFGLSFLKGHSKENNSNT